MQFLRLIDCFRAADAPGPPLALPRDASGSGRALVGDERAGQPAYRAPVVTPSPRASSASSLAAAGDRLGCGPLDGVGDEEGPAARAPWQKRSAPEVALSAGPSSSSSGGGASDAAARDVQQQQQRQHRRSGSGGSAARAAVWPVSDTAPFARPRSALGGSGGSSSKLSALAAASGGAKLAGSKALGSSLSFGELGAGGVGAGVLPGAGDQDEDDNDEDCCATCLESYGEDNPRIWTRCGHHFHAQCIYEWLERKETCPLCESQIHFDEL